jgi:hypothetical protein
VAPPSYDPGPGLEKAAALQAAGKFEDALELLRNESREVRKIEGEESPKVLLVNDVAAEILLDQGVSEKSEAILEKAENLLGKTIASREAMITAGQVDQALVQGKSFLTLAKVRMAAKRTRGAIDAAASGLPLLDQGFGPHSDEVRQALDLLDEAVDAMDSLLGPKNPTTLEVREKAARVFESYGQFDRAITHQQRIVAGYAAGAVTTGDKATEALEHLVYLMRVTGRADDAIAVLRAAPAAPSASQPSRLRLLGDLQLAANRFRSAHVSMESMIPPGSADTSPATTASRLCRLVVSIRQGHANAVPDWFGKTIEPLLKSSGRGATAAVDVLLMAGDILLALDDAPAAIEPLTKALGLAGQTEKSTKKRPPSRRTKPGAKGQQPTPETPEIVPAVPRATSVLVAEAAGRLTAAHLSAGEADAARQVAEPALATAALALGPGDARVAYLRVLLADAVRAAGDTAAGIALGARALDYGLPRPDDVWEERVTAVYDRLAAADGKLAPDSTLPESEGKDDLREAYVAERERQFGKQHRYVASAWGCFGNARLAAGDWAGAAGFYSRSLDLQRAILGNDHPDVAATLSLQAHAMRLAGNAAEAAQTAAQAATAWERIAGPNHPGTLAALDILATASIQAGIRDGVVESLKRLCAASSITDPARQTRYLVQLAEVTAKADRATATTSLHAAMKLPCWDLTAKHSPSQRLQLAATAARASRVFNVIGDPGASTEAIQKARALVMNQPNTRELHERLDRLASPNGKAASDW